MPPTPSTLSTSSPSLAILRPFAALALAGVVGSPAPVAAQGLPRGPVVAALDPSPAGPAWAVAAAPASVASGPATPGPASSPAPAGRWEVRTQDITLSRTLERWAAQAGYRLRWDAARNFLIAAPDVYQGGFEDAVQAVLDSAGIRESDYPLEACVYANTPPLVRITRRGEQSRECHA